MNDERFATENKIRQSKIISLLTLALSILLVIAVCVSPIGLFQAFAEEGNSKNDSNVVDIPDYNPSEYETADEIKKVIDELVASLGDMDKMKNDLYLQLEEALENRNEIESKYLADKVEADAEIQIIEIKLDIFQQIIDQYDLLIKNKEEEINVIVQEFNEIYDIFEERLRQSYEEGLPSSIEILLKADSFIEMLTSIERMKDILQYDTEVMEVLEGIEKQHMLERQELQKYLDEQQGVVKELEEGRASLEAKVAESLEILDIQDSNIDEYLLLLEITEQNQAIINQRIEQAVKDYYAHLGNEEQKEYRLTEEYKRAYVLPDIIKKMEEGTLAKGLEYFTDGDQYIWPLPTKYHKRAYITSTFGWRTYTDSEGKKVTNNHKGYDIGCPFSTEIYAARSGNVITAAYNSSYGYYIVILHDDGTTTLYAHCSKLIATKGEYVLQGENIARVGSTGNSTGNHLHIEVRINNSPVDPSQYIAMPAKNN